MYTSGVYNYGLSVMPRREPLANGEIHHLFSKSIAGYKIFYNSRDITRMAQMLRFYKLENLPDRFCRFINRGSVKKEGFGKCFVSIEQHQRVLVQIIAYCFMPTHFHLVLQQVNNDGISTYMRNLLNSYTRYFNTKRSRKGPLWEGRFKNVRVTSDRQLLHLTRYIHLNPVTAHLVEKPEEWPGSSYREYVSAPENEDRICEYGEILDVQEIDYPNFVAERISYQRELAILKDSLKMYTPEVYIRRRKNES